MDNAIQDVPVGLLPIRLGQFLKYSSLVEDGAMAKSLLADGAVTVNGSCESRRGAQLNLGDIVEFEGQRLRVAAE